MTTADSRNNFMTEPSVMHLEQLQAVVNRYCLAITGSHWEADDLAQNTWLKAIGTLRGPGHRNPEALLLRIAKNTWIDHNRRKATLTRIQNLDQPEIARQDVTTMELEAVFHALIQHLSPMQRTVFLLRDLFDYSIAETAETLGMTQGAVKAAHHRARHALEAVRAAIRANSLAQPEAEDLKQLLHALASAYEAGDISTLVQLASRGVMEPTVAIGMVQNHMFRKTSSVQTIHTKQANSPGFRMAA